MTLLELLQLLKKHLALVIVLPVVCAVAMAVVAYGFMANTYTAETTLYVLAQNDASGTSTLQSSMSASQLVANDVAALADSKRVTDDTAAQLGLADLKAFKVNVSSQTTSRVITLSVEGKNAQQVADVANAMAASVSSVAVELMRVDSVSIVDQATAPLSPSGPKRTMYVAVAFLAGLFVAVAFVVLIDMLNTKVRSAEDAEELLGVPVIGRMPALRGGGSLDSIR